MHQNPLQACVLGAFTRPAVFRYGVLRALSVPPRAHDEMATAVVSEPLPQRRLLWGYFANTGFDSPRLAAVGAFLLYVWANTKVELNI